MMCISYCWYINATRHKWRKPRDVDDNKDSDKLSNQAPIIPEAQNITQRQDTWNTCETTLLDKIPGEVWDP